MTEVLAELKSVSKNYGPVDVLRNVDFDVRAGETHALLGGNGAGKSTLMRILAGLTNASGGNVRIGGELLLPATPARAQAMGLYLVPQEAHIFPNQSVLENICIGLPKHARTYRDRVGELIAQLGVSLNPEIKAATLEIADRQLVEILRGMIREAQVLILDEPTSALTPHEVAALFARMDALRASGKALVFISHKLHELRATCNRITVLRDGGVVLTGEMSALTDDKILAAMSPEAKLSTARQSGRNSGQLALGVDKLSGEGFSDISFALHGGEVLGLTGVVGAGRTELAETLFGLRSRSSGRISLCGVAADLSGPREAVDAGLVYLSEDRQEYGLFLSAPLFWNTSSLISHLLPFLLRPASERRKFDNYRKDMSIRCESPDQPTRSLSGGNQQKVLLSKCLAAQPKVLILDEPTRGVDVGARNDIYHIVETLAAQGTAVLLVSSDFDEVVRLSDRILVMAGGGLAGTLPAGVPTEAIAQLAFEAREHADA